MKKKLLFIFILITVFPNSAYSAPVDNVRWEVIKFVGDKWNTKPKNIIGKFQTWERYMPTEGVFYNCPTQTNVNASESKTYNTYKLDEFLENKKFKLFKKYRKQLGLPNANYYVQRITCEGDDKYRSVLYPFITPNKNDVAYYPFEGGIYVLKPAKKD